MQSERQQVLKQTDTILRGLQQELQVLRKRRKGSPLATFYDALIAETNEQFQFMLTYRKKVKDGIQESGQ